VTFLGMKLTACAEARVRFKILLQAIDGIHELAEAFKLLVDSFDQHGKLVVLGHRRLAFIELGAQDFETLLDILDIGLFEY
jgi:hypothetical protein